MLLATSEYALRIMVALTEAEGRPLTSDETARHTQVPSDYALKILQQLAQAGFIRARRGRGGGYRLDCDPTRTTLLDIVEVIQPIERIRSCPLGRASHRLRLCALHHRLDEAAVATREALSSLTLAEAVDDSPSSGLCRESGVPLTVSKSSDSKRGKRKSG
ncbi:MAG: Rrf2 family transcriptional regulator [Phycisphaerales bacterium]